MFTIREYAMPETLDEAYTILKSRKGNQILGGCAWLRLGKKRINIAVDLTKCGLDYIREDERTDRDWGHDFLSQCGNQ